MKNDKLILKPFNNITIIMYVINECETKNILYHVDYRIMQHIVLGNFFNIYLHVHTVNVP